MKKRQKLQLHRETLRHLTQDRLRSAAGAAVVAPIGAAQPFSGDLRNSCLCVTDPETVCLCPEETGAIAIG